MTTILLRADAHGDVLSLEAPGRLTLNAEADPDRRTIEGLVVPYGAPGRTNLGPVAVRAGAVRLPADGRVIGIVGHDRERPVARMSAFEDTPAGLRMRFRVAPTQTGDQLLAEVASGVRDGLSVEMSDLTFDPATGDITSGLCEFVAFVPVGAYDQARVASVTASTHPTQIGDDVNRRHLARARFGREFVQVGGGGVLPAQPTAAPAAAPAAPAQPAPAQPAPAQPAPAQPAPAQLSATVTEVAPAPAAPTALSIDAGQLGALLAQMMSPQQPAAVGALPSAATVLPTTAIAAGPAADDGAAQVQRLTELQAAVASGTADRTLYAALADITNSDLPIFQRPAGAIPQELWANVGYTRRFVPLLTQRPLTSYKFGGWEFVQRPEVGDWSGDKTEIPTNEVTTREIEATAARIAGGWDVDRKYRDFGDAQFWSAFYAAQTESYARLTDAKAAAAIVAAAQDVTATAPVTGYTRPAGFGTVTDQADVLRAVAFGTAYLEETPLIEQGPDFVLMNTADYMGLLDIAQLDAPEFLGLFGVAPGAFRRTNKVPAGSVILGVKRALEFYELPGAAPIRVEALDVARGGVDSAVYGYWGTLHVRPGGIISVPLVAAG